MESFKSTLPIHSRFYIDTFEYLNQVFDAKSQSATQGSMVNQFETHFKQWFDMKHGIAFNSGTSTLHAILLSLGVGPNDEVCIPSLGPIMDTFAVLQCGATPVFVDCIEGEYTIDAWDLSKKITAKTKAIIVVHLYGGACRMDEIMAISISRNIPVIEDCAQAVLTTLKYGGEERMAGTIGIASSFSFESSKHLSTGEGGMVLTNNTYLAEKIRKIGGLGFANLGPDDGLVRRDEKIFQSHDYKRHSDLGYNYRLTEFQAAIGLSQSKHLNEILDNRMNQGLKYLEVFNPLIRSGVVKVQPEPGNSYYTFAVEFCNELIMRRFLKLYEKAGGDKYYACWSVPYLEPICVDIGLTGNCPNSERMQRTIIQLKTSYQDYIEFEMQLNAVREAVKEL